MADANDMELVRQYAESGSEPAFAELVQRHLNLVYSVACRFSRQPDDAQDIAQAVFIMLAQKAPRLSPKTVLTGWLYETTRYTAMNLLRTRARQQAREQEAYMQSTLNDPDPDDAWKHLEPLLEEAMSRLGEKDRTLLALRFFENKSGAEAAGILGIGEWAARKRVERSVEKLRAFFERRGVTVSSQTLTESISVHSIQAAPALLAKTVAVAAAKGAGTAASTSTLIKGALKLMAWSKAKTAVITGVGILLAGSTTVVTLKAIAAHSVRRAAASPDAAAQFKAEVISRMNVSKQWGLAFLMYANDNGGNLPKNFADAQRYAPSLPSDEWEITASGNINQNRMAAKTVTARLKSPMQPPDGGYEQIYLFLDGHCQVDKSADGDFAAVEKQRGYIVNR